MGLRKIVGSDEAAIAVFNYLNQLQTEPSQPTSQPSSDCNHWEYRNEEARKKYPYAARGPGRHSSNTPLCNRPTRSPRLKRRKFRILSRSK